MAGGVAVVTLAGLRTEALASSGGPGKRKYTQISTYSGTSSGTNASAARANARQAAGVSGTNEQAFNNGNQQPATWVCSNEIPVISPTYPAGEWSYDPPNLHEQVPPNYTVTATQTFKKIWFGESCTMGTSG